MIEYAEGRPDIELGTLIEADPPLRCGIRFKDRPRNLLVMGGAVIDTETGFLFCPKCGRVVLQVNLNSCCSKCGYRFCSTCSD
jgi:hypothetical protein